LQFQQAALDLAKTSIANGQINEYPRSVTPFTTSTMKVGTRIVIARERILIPEGERAEFAVPYKETTVRFTVEFKADVPRGNTSGLTWDNVNEVIRIRFATLSTTPVVTMQASQLGTFDDGSKLLLLAEYFRYASIGIISLQLMVQEVLNAS
jgi:hypothetical protein